VPVLSKFYHAHLPLQTCRACFASSFHPFPVTPYLPLLTESGLNDPRHSAPSLPDLNSPVLIFPLATLTHLACRACGSVSRLSALASPISPSLPCLIHLSLSVATASLLSPPARTFLSASLVACHHKPCPTQTLAANLHPPFRACYSLPIRPFQTRPFHTLSCLTC